MKDNVTALYELANDAIRDVSRLEGENAKLRSVLAKQASVQDTARPSDAAVEKAVDCLVKSGALKNEQRTEVSDTFKNDPDAALRAITGLVDAHTQMKTASKNNIDGGRLTGKQLAKSASYSDLPDRMMKILQK